MLAITLGVVAGAAVSAVAFVAIVDSAFAPYPLGPEGLSDSSYNAGTGAE